MAKILVGLSGGVDSSVTAALLLEQGHEVVAGYMKNWINQEGIPGDCPWEEDLQDATAVAEKLGIELRVVDLIDAYKERIVDYLVDGYAMGYTPNPDVFCNREMKFGIFLEYALAQGFDGVATGHYARVTHDDHGEAHLLRGLDNNKDQSYFLSMMTQEQLQKAYFPIGEYQKAHVRELAEKFELPTAKKKDSQGICFIGQIKMKDFLKHYLPNKPGNIITRDGKVMGKHEGLHFYTIGQRKGHGVASPIEGKAYVVVAKNQEKNQLIVGWDDPNSDQLYSCTWRVANLSWQDPSSQDKVLLIQPRYRSPAIESQITYLSDEQVEIKFSIAQRAIAAGQICAFYRGDELVGAGIFENCID